jgi:hypothetical protein
VPYTRRVCKEFGGGWVHFCGAGHQVLDAYLGCPEVKGLNFGNPEMFDEQEVLTRIAEHGQFYFGSWPRNDEESLREYFARILRPFDGDPRALILQAPIYEGERERAMDLWHDLH